MDSRPEVRPLDPDDDRALHRFHEILWRSEKEDGRPWNACWSYEELARKLREQTPERRTAGLLAIEDGTPVGAGLVDLPMLDNLDKGFVLPAVEPEHRGRGVGGLLLEAMLDELRRERRTLALAQTAVPVEERTTSPMVRFALGHGFSVANTEIVRILRLPLPEGLLDEVAAETAAFCHGYEIETYVDELPARHLAAYSHLRNQLALDAPTGDVDFEAEQVTPEIEAARLARSLRMGRQMFLSLAVKDGEAVAHSDIAALPSDGQAHQLGTLVRRDHRGHRLGTAVKVANLAALQKERPDVTEVHTQNEENNGWMVDINVRLGFTAVGACPGFQRRL
jgi:GNAT superfamily N-acetyltransferase